MARALTKTAFLEGRQCDLRLWRTGQGIAEYSVGDGDMDPVADFIAESALVESYAYDLFPGGVGIIEPVNDDEEAEVRPNRDARIESTRHALADPNTTAIFQAHLAADSLFGIVDILEKSDSGWIVVEVKASTGVKSIHHVDLAFQVHLARACGLTVVGAAVVHLNKEYEYSGGDMRADSLLSRVDVTQKVFGLDDLVTKEIERQQRVLRDPEPVVAPSSRCKGSPDSKAADRPSTCGHLSSQGACGSGLAREWAWYIPKLSGAAKLAAVSNLPKPDMRLLDPQHPTQKWSPYQQAAIQAAIDGEAQVDRNKLRGELEQLVWPVTYMDFEYETGMAVPRFVGTRPYQQIPFQWSMHIQPTPGAPLDRPEPFLHTTKEDPRRPFIESLLAALPDSGSIVVHSSGAEMGVLNRFKDWFGDEFALCVPAIEARIVDTHAITHETYCHPDQRGSWSIKRLAEPLTGGGYKDLDVQDGMEAVRRWRKVVRGEDPNPELTIAHLREYCGRDTELMHDVLESLRKLL
tara:strand:+ start:34281 stop:35840 length:1560 start_codon:yes stop_codon:yes gene_type:complete